MSHETLIKCRVCGKFYKPCLYCQSHTDVFRWKNFACSRECALKYINDTISYRQSLKDETSIKTERNNKTEDLLFNEKKEGVSKRKYNKSKHPQPTKEKNEINKPEINITE